MTETAAQALVETLARHGVDRVFCVPGESYLDVLDALYDHPKIQTITCRHESGAGLMAVTDAKITERPGIVFVSRGPGASNAAVAVYVAKEDAAPLILFIGQVPRADRKMGAFQYVDYKKTFSDLAKCVIEVDDPDQLAAAAATAYQIAQTGTPGPVVVSMPEDMLAEAAAGGGANALPVVRPRASDEEISAVAQRLGAAERPLMIVGGGVSSREARHALAVCSQAWQLPVATSFKRQDLFTNDHPLFAGHLGYGIPPIILETLSEADLVLAVGTRLGDVTSQGFRLPRAPKPDQPLIHVYTGADEIGRRFKTDLAVVSEAATFLDSLAGRNAPPPPPGRTAWCERVHGVQTHLARWQPVDAPDGVSFGHVIAALAEALPQDAIITNDAGNFTSWMHRYFPFRSSHTLVAAVSGSMGLGVPSGVAAALRCPDRQVVTLVGDGGFLMTGNELATAVQYNARVRLFVSNNNSYGTIRLHQEKHFPGRIVATDLKNPNFKAMAESFGAKGLSIKTPDEAEAVVQEALNFDGPVVIDVASSLEHISAYTTLENLAAAKK